jgi:hypothetical protein
VTSPRTACTAASFRDVEELIVAVENYIDGQNANQKPLIWTAKATDILEKVKRVCALWNKRHFEF